MSKTIKIENSTTETLNHIHKYFGISFVLQGGKIIGANFEGDGSKPTRKINLERVEQLIRKHELNC